MVNLVKFIIIGIIVICYNYYFDYVIVVVADNIIVIDVIIIVVVLVFVIIIIITIIYILKFNVPVGWLVRWLIRWLVGLSGFHAPTGRRIGTVYMSKEPSRPRNEPRWGYFRIGPHLGGIKGGRNSP